jgi:hypothetical protein
MSIDFAPGLAGGEVHVIVLAWLLSGLMGTLVFVQLTRKYYDDLLFARDHHLSALRCSISLQAVETSLVRLGSMLIVVGTGTYTLLTEIQLEVLPQDAATDPIAPWIAIIPWLMVIQGLREYRHQTWLVRQLDHEEYAG